MDWQSSVGERFAFDDNDRVFRLFRKLVRLIEKTAVEDGDGEVPGRLSFHESVRMNEVIADFQLLNLYLESIAVFKNLKKFSRIFTAIRFNGF